MCEAGDQDRHFGPATVTHQSAQRAAVKWATCYGIRCYQQIVTASSRICCWMRRVNFHWRAAGHSPISQLNTRPRRSIS